MNQKQDNVATMFEATNLVLDTHQPLWQTFPAFADAVTRARSGTAAIREKMGQQVPTGDAAEKAMLRDDLEERTLMVADMLGALAAKTADALLAAEVDVNKSGLDRMPDSDLVLAAKRVQAAATIHAAKLASDYGVPAADLTAFGDAVTAFDAKKTTPRDAVVARRVATLSLPEAITFVRGIYRNELDRLMTRFKATQADFYAAYFGARVVVDRPATRPGKPAPTMPPPVVPPQPQP